MTKMILYYCFSLFAILILPSGVKAQDENLDVALTDDSQLTIEGPHRFIEINGITGLQVTSLKTKAFVETNALKAEKGTVSLWMSSTESIDKSYPAGSLADLMSYPLLSDRYPSRNSDSCNFSVYYWGAFYPRLIGRFSSGRFWQVMDYGLAPFVYAEDLPLLKGQWYHVVITWNKPEQKLVMYVNGQMAGHNYSAKDFMQPGSRLYVGNPLMVVSRLKILNQELTPDQIRKEYKTLRPATNAPSDESLRARLIPQNKPDLSVKLDGSWEKIYECKFNRQSDLLDWKFQTGDLFRNKFKLEVMKDGLYWETPDTIHTESRGYLWCPAVLDGDCWIEYEFQPVSPKGVGLLMIYASGAQGEDVVNDHGLVKTGDMSDMLENYRNYHWEYFRHVEACRTDVETQYLQKNPWWKIMYAGCVPLYERGKWHKIRFIKSGDHLFGSLDGKTVFSVTDDLDNNGPILNSGRVVLREMYHTAMLYRNFVIYRKKGTESKRVEEASK